MNKIKYEILEPHVFVTKLAGFEHSEYVQHNETKRKKNPTDIPLVQGKNVRKGFFVEKFEWYIKKEISDYLKRSKLTKVCILVPYVGSNLGEVGIFYHPYDCHLASNIAKIELLDDYFDIEYLKYYLQSPIGQGYLFQNKQGSAQPNITMESIRNTLVIDYPKKQQIKIANLLKTIDDKININNKINSEFESMAKTLYDYWFLQFEFPNAEGRPYKSSGGKIFYNEQLKKEIPEGWEVLKVKDLLDVVTGKEDSNFATDNGKYKFFTCSSEVLNCDNYAFDGKAVLLAGNGDFNVKHYQGKFNAYQRTYVLIPNDDIYFGAIYMATIRLVKKLKTASNGSIVKFITKGDVENIEILKPVDDKLLEIFNKILTCIEKNNAENQELASLRDFLLPLLMNGQVTVGE